MQWKVRDVAAMVALSGASLMTLASPVSVKMDFALGHVNLRIGETSPGSNDIRADVGAFKGMAGASTGFDTDAFITYCVELTQGFSINTLYAGSYSMVDGASYFGGLNTALAAGPAVALERLVQLFSSLGGAVPPASPDQSAAQLANELGSQKCCANHARKLTATSPRCMT